MLVSEVERIEDFVRAICMMSPSHRDAVCDFVCDVLKQLKVEEYCRHKAQDKCDELEKELSGLVEKSSVYEDEEESDGET